ncbi:hypothetical protein ABEB36_002532 [Hypothenemus hampei]|uniref:Coactosin-like protein n=1 Tax=Hypothenemus hampei TaxID=57062 RepID=A0ABD1F621_HYPHA
MSVQETHNDQLPEDPVVLSTNEETQQEKILAEEHVVEEKNDQPIVQEEACILKKNVSISEITQEFLLNEQSATDIEIEANSSVAATVDSETLSSLNGDLIEAVDEVRIVEDDVVVEVNNSLATEELQKEPSVEPHEEISNGQSANEEPPVLNGTIASELIDEDYSLPEVSKVKKNFENLKSTEHGSAFITAPPKKGALSTTIDTDSIKKAYQDVRYDGSATQWAVFKFEGPTIVTSATGSDFTEFRTQFVDDERAFGYIRMQTGDEMSRRAKFLLVTWVGPSVSVLKRAKMSTDKAIIKDIVSNFAVELQTENLADINLQNFETELDKAAGAHYGTGIMG